MFQGQHSTGCVITLGIGKRSEIGCVFFLSGFIQSVHPDDCCAFLIYPDAGSRTRPYMKAHFNGEKHLSAGAVFSFLLVIAL